MINIDAYESQGMVFHEVTGMRFNFHSDSVTRLNASHRIARNDRLSGCDDSASQCIGNVDVEHGELGLSSQSPLSNVNLDSSNLIFVLILKPSGRKTMVSLSTI